MADPNTRQGKRTPVTLKIKFKSETLEQFIERYAVDVSQGGIFIRTKEPLAVGTQMKFEFQLRDASPLIAGEGTVVWTRENDPSRPAIAPGMGVRFDKLADGSQAVLEKILAEKAKQAPSRENRVTAPGENKGAGAFTDVPTRVAPAPVQEALGLRSRQDSEQTPLPRPMPFHGDAEDFDERAFDEATKVRSLDDLAAESARDTGNDDDDDGSGLSDNPKHATVLMPADELAVRRRVTAEREVPADALQEIKNLENVRRSGQIPVAEGARTSKSGPVTVPDRDSAPTLPSPPSVDSGARTPRVSDAPANRPAPSSEPAMLAGSDAADEPAPRAAASKDTAAPRAIASEPSRPSAPGRPSILPIVLGIVVAVGVAGGAVWYFVLRDKGQPAGSVAPNKQPTTNPAVPDKGSDMAAAPGTGSAATPTTGSASTNQMSGSAAGSAAAMTGSGTGSASPAGPTVDTVITASVAKGATVEIVGTDQKGPAPFTAKLEKDKTYKVHVTAPFFAPADIDVKAGANATAKLVPDPHTLTVSSDPAGAEIYIDNVDTQKLTPADVTLTAAQIGKPRIRVTLRRAGYRPLDQVVESTAFKDDGTKASASISPKLQQQQQVVRPPNPGGNGTTGGSASAGSASSGSGGTSGTTSGTGGTEGGGESGSASAPPPPPPPPPPAAGAGSGSGGQVLK